MHALNPMADTSSADCKTPLFGSVSCPSIAARDGMIRDRRRAFRAIRSDFVEPTTLRRADLSTPHEQLPSSVMSNSRYLNWSSPSATRILSKRCPQCSRSGVVKTPLLSLVRICENPAAAARQRNFTNPATSWLRISPKKLGSSSRPGMIWLESVRRFARRRCAGFNGARTLPTSPRRRSHQSPPIDPLDDLHIAAWPRWSLTADGPSFRSIRLRLHVEYSEEMECGVVGRVIGLQACTGLAVFFLARLRAWVGGQSARMFLAGAGDDAMSCADGMTASRLRRRPGGCSGVGAPCGATSPVDAP